MPMTYAPAVLIVDDDVSITRYLREQFHEQTSVGVLVANDLGEARELLDDQSIAIDAILADLHFEQSKRAPESDLIDGIDLLQYSRKRQEKLRRYVLSFWFDRTFEHDKANSLHLQIDGWLPKMFYANPHDLKAPWLVLETELIESRVPGASEFIRKLNLPLRTFIQHVEHPEFETVRPIEVICFQESEGRYRSYPLNITLLGKGEGESVNEALDHLASVILDHFQSFEQESDRLRDFALDVEAQINAHVRRKGTAHNNDVAKPVKVRKGVRPDATARSRIRKEATTKEDKAKRQPTAEDRDSSTNSFIDLCKSVELLVSLLCDFHEELVRDPIARSSDAVRSFVDTQRRGFEELLSRLSAEAAPNAHHERLIQVAERLRPISVSRSVLIRDYAKEILNAIEALK